MPSTSHKQGILFAFAAYGIWGIAPIYFKQLAMDNAWEIVAHRVVWSCVLLFLLVPLLGRLPAMRALFRQPKRLLLLGITSLLVASNWLIFIWAVTHGHMLDASLGYYINPLFNVLLGMLFLQERLNRMQTLALALACTGVGFELYQFGAVPWIALSLALTFSVYGLVRKQLAVDGLVALCVETALVLPLAAYFLLHLGLQGEGTFLNDSWHIDLLLLLAGVVTTTPLLLFNGAARRIALSTLGFIQYLAPTLMFLLAVLMYGEAFSSAKLVTFGFIWLALLVFSGNAWWRARTHNKTQTA